MEQYNNSLEKQLSRDDDTSLYFWDKIPKRTFKQQINDAFEQYDHPKIDEDSVVQITECYMCKKPPTSYSQYIKLECGHTFCRTCMMDYLKEIPEIDIKCTECQSKFKEYKCYEWICKKYRHYIRDKMGKQRQPGQRNKKTRTRIGKELNNMNNDYQTGIGTYENMTYDFGDDDITLKHDKNSKLPIRYWDKEMKRLNKLRYTSVEQREHKDKYNDIEIDRWMNQIFNENKK